MTIPENNGFAISEVTLPTIEPGQKGELRFTLLVPQSPGQTNVTIGITHNHRTIPLESRQVTIIPAAKPDPSAQPGMAKNIRCTKRQSAALQKDQLIHEFPGQTLAGGRITIKEILDIVPGEQYRVVAIVPNYLPRQKLQTIGEGTTLIQLPRFLPLDFKNDGAFTVGDIITLINTPPHAVLSRFFGP